MSKVLHLYFDYCKFIILGLIGFVVWIVPLALAGKLFTLSPTELMFVGLLEIVIAINLLVALRLQTKLDLISKFFQNSKKLQRSH